MGLLSVCCADLHLPLQVTAKQARCTKTLYTDSRGCLCRKKEGAQYAGFFMSFGTVSVGGGGLSEPMKQMDRL